VWKLFHLLMRRSDLTDLVGQVDILIASDEFPGPTEKFQEMGYGFRSLRHRGLIQPTNHISHD
jgi:hypothetical protein